MEWFRKAADHGHTRAQSCLGDALFYGDGVPINKTAAAAWYREAAEEGHGDAQYKIGLAYFSGDGVKVDQGAAVEWLRKAAEQGHADAQHMTRRMGVGVPLEKGLGPF